jgi:uncharacterized protein
MSNSINENFVLSIQKLGQKYLIEKIVLFGSRARGDNKITSDIDFAIFSLPEFKNQGYLASEIDDLETLLKIDVVFIDENTEIKLLENIKKEGLVIYERL